MHIDWAALGTVALVSVVASVVFVALLATGIRVLVAQQAAATPEGRVGSRGALTLGYGLLGLSGLLVLYGIYLIVPQLH